MIYWILSFAKSDSSLLTKPWWQGVAGIAQVLAAILTIVAVYQSWKMSKRADAQQRESARPDWDLENESCQPVPPGEKRMEFVNTGFGIARRIEVKFDPESGAPQLDDAGSGRMPSSIRPDCQFTRRMKWQEPFNGWLIISCTTRLGEHLSHRFRVDIFKDEKDEWQCEIARQKAAG